MKNSSEARFPMFGKEVEIVIYGADEPIASMMLEDTYKEGLKLQKIFNLYDPESELSELNRRRSMDVSDELLAVIKTSMGFSRLTDGLYDVSKGRAFLLRKSGRSSRPVKCSYRDILIEGRTVTLRHSHALIDLGSIAKGFIVDRMVDYMKKLGLDDGFVDARGDLRSFGEHRETINIQHPRDRTKQLYPMLITDKSVATSGDYNQYINSFKNSHIVGQSELISVTVVAESLMVADALATCIMLLGRDRSTALLEMFPGAKAFTMDSVLAEHMFNGFESLVTA